MRLIIKLVPQVVKSFKNKLDICKIKYELNIANNQFSIPDINKFQYSIHETTQFNIVFEDFLFMDIQKDNITEFEVR